MPDSQVKPVRARCPLGGSAPCVDDLCRGVDITLCGLGEGIDFCPHGFLPSTCDDPFCDDGDSWEAAVMASADDLGVELDGG